jgi:hypothetical protein
LYLVRRTRNGSILARPTSDRWRASYGQVLQSKSFLFDLGFAGQDRFRMQPELTEELRRAIETLYELSPRVTLRTRDTWPAGAPLFIAVETENYWPWPTGIRVYARPSDRESEWIYANRSDGFVLVEVEPGVDTLRFDLDIHQIRQSEPDASWESVEEQSANVEYRIAGSIKDVMTATSSPELEEMMRGIVYSTGEGWVSTDVRATQNAATQGIAFGVIMEFSLNGEPLAEERFWWQGGAQNGRGQSHSREWLWTKQSPWRASPGEEWTIRIRSDAVTALRVLDASNYWEGEVTIPLNVQGRASFGRDGRN